MRIDIRGNEVSLAESTRAVINTKTRLALDRVAPEAKGVLIVIRDPNGPKKGLDRACVVDVRLRSGNHVHAEATADTLMDAVDRALGRASRSARRVLARRVEFRRETIRFTPDAP